MLRVYHIFTSFGKLGKKWSNGVLFAGILLTVGASIIFLVLWRVLGGVNRVKNVVLVTPEDSFPYYYVIQACTPPSIVFTVLDSLQIVLLHLIVVLVVILTRKIRMQHFKNTKNVNVFIYLAILTSCILLPLSVIITDREIQVYLNFAQVNSHAVLCQMLLFLPKCLPPFCRHLKLQ